MSLPRRIGCRKQPLKTGVAYVDEDFPSDVKDPLKNGAFRESILNGLNYLSKYSRVLLDLNGLSDKDTRGKKIPDSRVFQKLKNHHITGKQMYDVLKEIKDVRNDFGHEIQVEKYYKREDLKKVAENIEPALLYIDRKICLKNRSAERPNFHSKKGHIDVRTRLRIRNPR